MKNEATAFIDQDGNVIITTFARQSDVAIAEVELRPGWGARDLQAYLEQVPTNGEPPECVRTHDGHSLAIKTHDHREWRRSHPPLTYVGCFDGNCIYLIPKNMTEQAAEYFGVTLPSRTGDAS